MFGSRATHKPNVHQGRGRGAHQATTGWLGVPLRPDPWWAGRRDPGVTTPTKRRNTQAAAMVQQGVGGSLCAVAAAGVSLGRPVACLAWCQRSVCVCARSLSRGPLPAPAHGCISAEASHCGSLRVPSLGWLGVSAVCARALSLAARCRLRLAGVIRGAVSCSARVQRTNRMCTRGEGEGPTKQRLVGLVFPSDPTPGGRVGVTLVSPRPPSDGTRRLPRWCSRVWGGACAPSRVSWSARRLVVLVSAQCVCVCVRARALSLAARCRLRLTGVYPRSCSACVQRANRMCTPT